MKILFSVLIEQITSCRTSDTRQFHSTTASISLQGMLYHQLVLKFWCQSARLDLIELIKLKYKKNTRNVQFVIILDTGIRLCKKND